MSEDPAAYKVENDYGPCCACRGPGKARNMVMYDFEGPGGPTGWGCLVCGLPPKGAVAVLCDACLEAGREPTELLAGAKGERVPMPAEDERVPFTHDLDKHVDELVPR